MSLTRISVLAATFAAVAVAAPAAQAHVTLNPRSVTANSFGRLDVRVPNERDDASTRKVDVQLPDGFAFASYQPVPGWSVKVRRQTLSKPIHTDDGDITDVVSHVTWSGGSIGSGQIDEFTIVAGALPDTGSSLVFKAIQTYANGDVVRWIDIASGGAEADHPAPTLSLVPAAAPKPLATKKRVDIALGLGLVAVILSAVATGIAITARRPTTPAG